MKRKINDLLIYIILCCIIVINLLLVCFKYSLFVILIACLIFCIFICLLFLLYKSNKESNRLIKMLPHDIKTPINSIKCLLELVKIDINDVTKVNKYICEIDNCLDHINNISLNMLDDRYEKVDIKDVSVNELVDNIASLMNPVMKNKNIVFSVNKLKEDYIIKTDPQKLTQVLVNLLSNACKYTPKYGFVIFEVLGDEKEIKFNIKDNGVGISENLMRNLFKERVRGDNVGVEGHGIGLSLCKQMVEIIGGSIEVNSKVNYGSTFTVSLYKNNSGNSLNLLIVDDCRVNADILATLIAKFGYNVTVLYNSLDVCDEIIKKGKGYYSVVITDMLMPGLDGISLSKKIKKINDEIKIICLSGEKFKHNKYINYFLLKPVDVNLLIDLINK